VLSGVAVTAGSELARLLAVRVPDLIGYRTSGTRAYAAFVERIRAEERRRVPGSSAVAEAVARNLYKLMAYKDEYEVARLSLDPVLDAEVEQPGRTSNRPWWRGPRTSAGSTRRTAWPGSPGAGPRSSAP
jgi:indolepyruvate ferredoxin oxidoreductase